jgi:hypothetical protein
MVKGRGEAELNIDSGWINGNDFEKAVPESARQE